MTSTNRKSNFGLLLYDLIDKIIRCAAILGAIMIVAIVILVFYEVFVRTVLNAPTVWTLELTIYCLIGSCFLSVGYLVREDKHIKVDILIESVPESVKRTLLLASFIVGLLFSILLTWYGWNTVISSFQLDLRSLSSLRLPMYIPHMLIPIGGILLSLSFILKIIEYL